MNRYAVAVVHFLMSAVVAHGQAAALESDADAAARAAWDARKVYFLDYSKAGTHQHLTCYYDLQTVLTPVLDLAVEQGNLQLLEDLVEVVEASYANLQTFEDIRNAVTSGVSTATPAVMDHNASGAGPKTRTWFVQSTKPDKRTHYDEVILYNTQYLFFVSRLVRHVASIPIDQRSERMKQFLQASNAFVLNDQLFRYVYRSRYSSWSELPEVTGFQSLELKFNRNRGRKDGKPGPAYYNAVGDIDLWLIASSAQWLAANGADSAAIPLGANERQLLKAYVDLGSALLQSRLKETVLKTFDGRTVKGLGFDHGIWAQHPEYAYAGYSGQAFPNDQDRLANPVSPDVGWDFSHASRFPHIYSTLFDCRKYTGAKFPSEQTMEHLANQFAYGVFNGDFSKPLFRNYMNGANGWYRVNYAGRQNTGTGPFMSSEAILGGSWALLGRFNPDVERIHTAVWRVLSSRAVDDAQHREKYYRAACGNLNQYAFFKLLPFSSAVASLKKD